MARWRCASPQRTTGRSPWYLSDGVLSGVRVPELLRRLRAERPQAKILLMSGYSQEAVSQNEIVDPLTAFLAKPFSIRQLTQRVREVLDAPDRGAPVGQRTGPAK